MLHTRRVQKKLEQILQKYFRQGFVPNPDTVGTELGRFLRENLPGKPTMKLRPQTPRGRMNLDTFNLQTAEFVDDVDLLYEEMIDIVQTQMRQISISESSAQIMGRQLTRIEEELDDLLLTSRGAGGFILTHQESFNDMTGIDQTQTSADVDLVSGLATLQSNAAATSRIQLPHLAPDLQVGLDATVLEHPALAWRVTSPTDIQPTGIDTVSAAGYAFIDEINAWQTVASFPTDTPIQMEVDIPLTQRDSPIKFVRASRIDIDPVVTSPIGIRILYSRDRTNFLELPGYEDFIQIEEKFSFRHEPRNMTWLRIQVRSNAPDSTQPAPMVGSASYDHVIGFKSIQLYKMGYAEASTLITQPFLPQGDEFLEALGRVSLIAEEELPSATDISWSIKQEKDDAPWISIVPFNRDNPGATLATRVVNFNSALWSPRNDNQFSVTTTPTLFKTRRAIDFYSLGSVVNTPVFGSGQLWPGINGWKRSNNVEQRSRRIDNNFIVFTLQDTKQQLYLTEIDEKAGVKVSGSDPVLSLRHTVLVDDSLRFVPRAAERNRPDYSIERILRRRSLPLGASDGVVTRIPGIDNEVVLTTSTVVPSVGYVGQYMHLVYSTINGYFRVKSAVQVGAAYEITLEDFQGVLEEASSITWFLDTEDLTTTDNIQSISGREITLNPTTGVTVDDEIIVTYRRPLASNERLVTDSIVLTSSRTGGQIYEQGADYLILEEEKSIARGPGGTIGTNVNQGEVVAWGSFTIVEDRSDIKTYVTNLEVQRDVDISVSLIGLDQEANEAVFLSHVPFADNQDTVSATKDVSEAIVWNLKRGVNTFTVRSRNLLSSSGTVDPSTAIYKLINLTDNLGNKVFQLGRYFTKQYALDQPLTQVTQTHFESLTPVNRDHFAFGDSGEIIVNHDPLLRTDLFQLVPGATVLSSKVDFELMYQYVPVGADTEKRLRIRAFMERGPNTDGERTPVIRSFALRYS